VENSIDELERFLVLTGHYTPEEVRRMAEFMVKSLQSVAPGASYGHMWPEDLPRLWAAAERNGRQRLVLEVSAEGQDQDEYDGHLSVRIVEASDWPNWDENKRVRFAYAEALAVQQGAPDPLAFAHRRAHAYLYPEPSPAPSVTASPPETSLQAAHRLVSEAMTRAPDPDQRDQLAQARKLLLDLQPRTVN
jgi:hypothetical protein